MVSDTITNDNTDTSGKSGLTGATAEAGGGAPRHFLPCSDTVGKYLGEGCEARVSHVPYYDVRRYRRNCFAGEKANLNKSKAQLETTFAHRWKASIVRFGTAKHSEGILNEVEPRSSGSRVLQ